VKKKTLVATLLVLAIVVGMVGAATSATAFPSKSKSCSKCHKPTTKVKIALTRASETTTTVTYNVKITGGKGTAGWALFQGTKNVKHKTASTGTFTATKGKTYKVWAVKKRSGSRYKTITPK
jgi:flagellar basal body-associated protein FliL